MLKDIKYYFENLFATKWTETSIHFAGQEFDPKKLGVTTWVNPYFSPTRRRNFGIGENSKVYYGDLIVVCWQDNDVEVMELGDKVSDFIDSNIDKNLFKIKGYDVIDHGWDSTNKAFLMLSFNLETIRGMCDALAKQTPTLIVHNGVQIVHNNVILTK